MKRTELLKHLKKYDCYLIREGGNHSLFYNPNSHKQTAVPRHPDILDNLCRKICKQLEIPFTK